MAECDEYVVEASYSHQFEVVSPDTASVDVLAETASRPVVVLVEPGIPGKDGIDGIDGAPGATGPPGPINSGFQHTQVSPAATWSVTHTLGRYPLSCEITVAGEVVFSDVNYPDAFTVVVTFATPQAGTLRLT